MHEKLQKVSFSIVSSLIIGGLIIAIIVVASNIGNVGIGTDSGLKTFLVGNGLCDDVTNTNVFEFDGGDCCLQNTIKGDCISCICYEIGESLITESTQSTTTNLITTTVLNISTTTIKEYVQTTTLPITTDWPGPCRNNWTLVNDLCYLISNESGTLEDTQRFCAMHDGIVFEPRSESEDLSIQTYLDKSKTYWLGFYDVYDEYAYGDGYGYLRYLSSGLEITLGYFRNPNAWQDYCNANQCYWSLCYCSYHYLLFLMAYEENQWIWKWQAKEHFDQGDHFAICQDDKKTK